MPSEIEQLEFVKAFRDLLRLKNVLSTFTEFSFDDLDITEQEFKDYQSKYLDIRDDVKNHKEKVSILNDIDFEVALVHRDIINVAYILSLLFNLKSATPKEKAKQRKVISDMMSSDIELRSKKELIEKFIDNNLPHINDADLVVNEFDAFWTIEKKKAINELCKVENLDFKKLVTIIQNYLFTQKVPLRDEVIALLNTRPSLRERATISERISTKIKDFVETFINGM